MKTRVWQFFRFIYTKIRWREITALIMLLLAFVFFHNEKHEISELMPRIYAADPAWMLAGALSTVLYILLQALMYVYSFRAANQNISLTDAIDIFLKRNLLSVFLPAGGVTSLAYLPKSLKKRNLPSGSVYLASSIYGFVGILSVFVVGIPLILFAVTVNKNFLQNLWMLAAIGAGLAALFFVYRSFRNRTLVYNLSKKYFPKTVEETEQIFAGSIDRKNLYLCIAASIIIEFVGVFQVLIAMGALGTKISVTAAALAYIISVILMMVSPFLRGLGAVEFSMAYILANFGYRHSAGLGITLLYRFFEFWLPLVAGIFSFFWNGRKLLARLLPTVLIFSLGIINILSVITPPIASRLHINEGYLGNSIIHTSKILTLVAGIMLILTAGSLLKGYSRAWYVAVFLVVFSIAGNLLKALDYEEAAFAFLVLAMLVYTRKEYRLTTKKFSFFRGIALFTMLFIAVMVMNFLSFYFIHPKHFGIDFTWKQSIYYTLHTFLFFKDSGLQPQTLFAKDFQTLNQFLGIFSWTLFLVSFYKISGISSSTSQNDFERASEMLDKTGTSPLDYFKISEDKKLFFSERTEGFVSYRTDKNFAVVLEMPVCEISEKQKLVIEFDEFCRRKGLRTAYYRVDEESKNLLQSMKKKSLLIGQEGILDAGNFKMEGKEHKSLRNAVNSLTKKGYHAELLSAPQHEDILNELQEISDEWLKEFDKKEIVFAEGKFDREILGRQDIIVLKDDQNNIKAFMNLIQDYTPNECTYDMIRRTEDAPNGAMDMLILKLVEVAKNRQIKYINLGLAPMSGLEKPDNTAEQIMKFAYHRVGNFKQYQSLRFFKEKYADSWHNRYLCYNNDADLLLLPVTLNTIMKP